MATMLRCPACRVKFPWDPAKGFPEYCPNDACETRIAHDRDDDDVVMPAFLSAASKANDTLYRQIEAGSEKRVELAAQAAGVDPSEMAGLKITNLNSTRHANDVAAVPVNNAVTQSMDAIKRQNPNANVGFTQNGLGFSGPVASGPHPNAGARTQSMVRQMHGERVGWNAVGDRPANEVNQPGYRRRV
jgi:hypothetical protein